MNIGPPDAESSSQDSILGRIKLEPDESNIKLEIQYIDENDSVLHDSVKSEPAEYCDVADNRLLDPFQTVKLKYEVLSHKRAGLIRVTINPDTRRKVFKCNLCGFMSSVRFNFWRHMSSHSLPMLFRCHLCDFCSKGKPSLTKHLVKHAKKQQLNCDECNRETGCKRCEMHVVKQNRKKSYKCGWCSYVTTNMLNLDKHKVSHLKKRCFKCTMCDIGPFSCLRDLDRHMLKHAQKKSYKCNSCEYVVQTKTLLKLHEKTHLPTQYKCDKCDFTAMATKHLKHHIWLSHVNNPLRCKKCDYVASAKNQLVKHRQCHVTTQLFICQLCPYTFPSNGGLKNHIAKFHSTKKVYRCDRCTYNSEDIKLLAEHMKTHLK